MIVVTGASKGIGLEIANRFSALGHEVLGIAREPFSAAFETATADVGQFLSLKKIAEEIKTSQKKVSGLINAAGIASMNLAVMTPPATIQNIINTNLVGTINSCSVFAPLMMRNKDGVIVNFSSIAVAIALSGESIYAASKAGIEAFTRTFAKEVSPHNLRAVCIAPGPIQTSLLRGITTEQVSRIVDSQSIRKQFEVSDIADLVELLFDKRSASLTGMTLNVGGV